MNPIENFKDHPDFEKGWGCPPERIYLMYSVFYIATVQDLRQVIFTELRYANMGEPFKQLARASYHWVEGEGEMDLSAEDAAILYHQINLLGLVAPAVEKELYSLAGFKNTLESLTGRGGQD